MQVSLSPLRWPLWFWLILIASFGGLLHCQRLKLPNTHSLSSSRVSSGTYNGLTIAPENRCSPYNKKQYPHSTTLRQKIPSAGASAGFRPGKIYAPYSNVILGSFKNTEIEHIVATSEAHDSGLCDADPETKKRFANDLLNLTLAKPDVNRQKGGDDLAEWQPQTNQCWFLDQVVSVKRKYNLTIDLKEAAAMKELDAQC